MKKKEFKSESKRLLDLMINSIYTNKDIFLRELISNASDALDKLYYHSLTDKSIKQKSSDYVINIATDKDEKTITITDTGCGMTKEELENNLGTIAKSGSLVFKEMAEKKKNVDIIGQFGVGFYSAFMVSKKIDVVSKSIDSEESYKWSSEGSDGYTVEPSNKKDNGTVITLYLKDDEEYTYSDYLNEYKIKELVKNYSDYIRYPIKMEVTHHDHEKDTKELEILNSQVPIWNKNKKDVKDEDYNLFYKDKFYDYENPLKVISYSKEGLCTYKGLLFIPSHAPYDFYTKEYEKGLELYSNGVKIMDKCKELLPDYFSFVRGIIDTEDVSLNISREMLQKTKSVSLIAKSVETKIKEELTNMLETDRKTYQDFFKAFGMQIKYGVYNNYGMDKDKLQDLLMFYTSKNKELVTLKEYVANMSKEQDKIYYACGETLDKIDNLPQVEQVKAKEYEILYLTEVVDEFTLNALRDYDGKQFVNVGSESLDLDSEEDIKKIKEMNESNQGLLTKLKEEIKVSDVRFTNKLKKHPVCLTTKGNISTEMEKIINAMPTDQKVSAEIVLEINANHKIASKLMELYKSDQIEFTKYAKILYSEARLIEGLPIDNPVEISNLIAEVISK